MTESFVPTLVPRQAARRERLLDAAERQFTLSGFRGATMEGLAAEAKVAKATFYAYFADKDAAFVAVCERIARRLADTADNALASHDDPRAGVIAAVQAKQAIAWQLAHSSPHARDLFDSMSRLAGDAITASDMRKRAAFTTALSALGLADPEHATAVLLASADGLAAAATSAAGLHYDLDRMAGALIDGWPRLTQ